MNWASWVWGATMLRIALARAAITFCWPTGGPTKSDRAVISTLAPGWAAAARSSTLRSPSLTRDELKEKEISTPTGGVAGIAGNVTGARITPPASVLTVGAGQLSMSQ